MSEAIEVKVKVSNAEQKYTKKFMHYGALSLTKEDPQLVEMVEGTLKEFKGPTEDVEVVFHMVW